MTYQALIHGANGLIYYTYQDGKFNVREHPELWAEMKKLVAEVTALSSVLLGPANDGAQFRAGDRGDCNLARQYRCAHTSV